jgi:hypothetical protein
MFVLRREALESAFGISVAADSDHEVANLRKCVGFSYSQLFFVSGNKRKHDRVARALRDCRAEMAMTSLAQEDIVVALDGLVSTLPEGSTVRGY